MNPQEPVLPDPTDPNGAPIAPVEEPPAVEGLDEYDVTVADSFPASDPPGMP